MGILVKRVPLVFSHSILTNNVMVCVTWLNALLSKRPFLCRRATYVDNSIIKQLNIEKVPTEFKVSDAHTYRIIRLQNGVVTNSNKVGNRQAGQNSFHITFSYLQSRNIYIIKHSIKKKARKNNIWLLLSIIY